MELRDLEVTRLHIADATAITRWRYVGPYAVYNRAEEHELESVRHMLDPRNRFYAVRGPSGLIGFCSFGADGRVPGGSYDDDALDLGAGMDPALTGHGHGQMFLAAVVAHAEEALAAPRLRATIASWNERALRAAQAVGFRPTATFRTQAGTDFTVLIRTL